MWDEALARLVTRELREIDALLASASEVLAVPKNESPSFERLLNQ